ncbi:MAG TPA: thiamine phosphate synthase [Elusimicrobia bacterium]|nr:MAG: thiamine-phosphate diphosphorylase [Elusimicrobia bacterium GWD2_63_28]HCC47224.1 thiamine phosphate synthase [Elusimicrobiota bacterium]
MKKLPSGLYVITDEKLMRRRDFVRKVAEAAAAGAGIIQLREKASSLRDRLALARAAVRAAHAHGAKLVINDDPELAALIGADGVHLGRDDASVEEARALLGRRAIIGVSCYGDIDLAVRVQKAGADYISFGACFKSPTKPREALVPLSVFAEARRRLQVPLVAIGGITPENAPLVYAAGADLVSVVSSVFAGNKTGQSVKQFNRRKK